MENTINTMTTMRVSAAVNNSTWLNSRELGYSCLFYLSRSLGQSTKTNCKHVNPVIVYDNHRQKQYRNELQPSETILQVWYNLNAIETMTNSRVFQLF